jgi:hypothetical protein
MASGVNVPISFQYRIRSLTYDSFEAKLCLAQKLYGKRHNSPNFLSIQKQDSLDYSGSSAALVIPKERALQNKACSLRSHGLFYASCRSSTLGSGVHKKSPPPMAEGFILRRRRDSNPRRCDPQRFSRPPHSTTLPLLRFWKRKFSVSNVSSKTKEKYCYFFLRSNGSLTLLA